MWIHLSSSPNTLLKFKHPINDAATMLKQNCRIESPKYFGKELEEIFIPYFQTAIKLVIAKY
jgi:hypothetical protein